MVSTYIPIYIYPLIDRLREGEKEPTLPPRYRYLGSYSSSNLLFAYSTCQLPGGQAPSVKSYKKYRNTSILVWSQELNQTRLVPDPRPACLGTYYLYSQPVDDEATVASAQIRTEKKITLAALLGNFRYNSVSISGSYHRYDTDVADRTRCKYLFLLLCIVDYLYSTWTPLSQ